MIVRHAVDDKVEFGQTDSCDATRQEDGDSVHGDLEPLLNNDITPRLKQGMHLA